MRTFRCIFLTVLIATLSSIGAKADSLYVNVPDTAQTIARTAEAESDTKKKPSFWRRMGKGLYALVRAFNATDTSYIEPQHYNYTLMLQHTSTYEMYKLTSKSGQEITFAPNPSLKLGPYVGWRWIFLGYTIDLTALNHKSGESAKREFDLSLYSSTIGIDLFWRKTGTDYKIRRVTLSEGDEVGELKGVPFSGLNVSIKGFNIYYIFNHKRFSYPAAFSQSTCQKRSCGSPLLGIGYTNHSLDLDYNKLKTTIESRLNGTELKLDSGLMFNNVRYTDYSLSGGYAYNWVFAKRWLFAASVSLALSYKRSYGDLHDTDRFSLRDFAFSTFNFEGVGRFGIVWNNTRWYAGMSTIIHSYSYKKPQFSTNNIFGSLNLYFGWNFGKR